MPLIHLTCKKCKKNRPRIFHKMPNYKTWGFCDCGGELVRSATGPTSQVIESLDNGVQQRAVERYADAERMSRDHAGANPETKVDKFV